MWKSCSADIDPGCSVGAVSPLTSDSSEASCECVPSYLCGVCVFMCLASCVCVCVCVCKLYQTLQSIGLRFIRYLRVRVRATCALLASLINTAATHPAWPRHFVTVNPPGSLFLLSVGPPSPPPQPPFSFFHLFFTFFFFFFFFVFIHKKQGWFSGGALC